MENNRSMPWRYIVAVLSGFAFWLGGGFVGRALAPFAEAKRGEAFNTGLLIGFLLAMAMVAALCCWICDDEEERAKRRKKAEEQEERLMRGEGLR